MSGTDDVMTVPFFWTLIVIFSVVYLAVWAVRVFRRDSARITHDLPALLDPCAGGHQWQPYSHGRTCLICWEVSLDRVYDQDLAPGTDLHQWERDMK